MSSIRNLTGKAHLQWPGAPQYHERASFVISSESRYLPLDSAEQIPRMYFSKAPFFPATMRLMSGKEELPVRFSNGDGQCTSEMPETCGAGCRRKVQNLSLEFCVLSWISQPLNPPVGLCSWHRSLQHLKASELSPDLHRWKDFDTDIRQPSQV